VDRGTEEADLGPVRRPKTGIPDCDEEHQQKLQGHLGGYGMLLVVEFPGRRFG